MLLAGLRSILVFLEYYGGVVASESESVGHHCIDFTLLSLVEGEVHTIVNLRIVIPSYG